MELNEQKAIEWQKRTSGELFIAEQEHFRQSDFFLNHYSELKLEIELILNGKLVELIVPGTHTILIQKISKA